MASELTDAQHRLGVWTVLGVAEENAIDNSFAYLFSMRERAVAFVERRLDDRAFAWSEAGDVLYAHYIQEYGGRSVYRIWHSVIDDEEYDAE